MATPSVDCVTLGYKLGFLSVCGGVKGAISGGFLNRALNCCGRVVLLCSSHPTPPAGMGPTPPAGCAQDERSSLCVFTGPPSNRVTLSPSKGCPRCNCWHGVCVCALQGGGGDLNARMHHQEEDRGLACEDIYSASRLFTSGPIQPVWVRLSHRRR